MINKPHRLFFIPKPRLVAALLALWVLQLWAIPADAGVESPLKPIDTSSPRATLQSFLEFMNSGYAKGAGIVESYLASPRLYLSPEDVSTIKGSLRYQESAQRALDLSELPPAMVDDESSRRLAIQLKEVLDRIDLPPIESIPDAQAMVKSEFKRWTLPNSEIRIQRVEKGPRTGEYLFTPETINRIPEFYAKIKDLPYKPGASVGWNDFSSYSPAGVALALYRIVPPRWLIDAPRHRARTTFLDQPVWRWFGIVAVLGAGLVFVLLCFRLSRYWTSRATSSGQWASLLRPISLMIVTPVAALILSQILRISGSVYEVVTLSLWGLFYLAFTWAVWVAGGALAVSLSAMEKLQAGSIDSQLIRLVIRLITVIAAIAILVAGADRTRPSRLFGNRRSRGRRPCGRPGGAANPRQSARLPHHHVREALRHRPLDQIERHRGNRRESRLSQHADPDVLQFPCDHPEQSTHKQHRRQYGIARIPAGQDPPQPYLRHAH